ncbi:Uncharacterized protein OS=Isosphaera pallida (strain ATCC 43644 / DSM 9630 / IS1B) GN=Isop_2427 PE=4 SV=1 [Gemmata massiliana]|uniref:Uncharacterized protein n=1 Tax=Gemmata massiliana TaxID=1210884 RepID=A0A6P2D2E6_9BACT|nr:hypothetical protein [Gemmata massiliana]VTR93570.1 Uncharacterized protein OS=Isosphaera pallida (strain ATCC 43644 / DSM 9630 / IS1B) GN=Isop_2427 PE=4 SV=1 [Gemmata massiliana]
MSSSTEGNTTNRFKDNAAREWVVKIHVFAVEQVENRTGVKIGSLIQDKLAGLIDLIEHPVKFVRVLWVLIEEQAVKLGVKPEQLAESLSGDALEAAYHAFIHALADFSPSRLRSQIRALITAGADQPPAPDLAAGSEAVAAA